MRADRLMRLVALLRRHGKLPARRLAELLEVSERTVLRDMEALSAAGVPVYQERGRHGGCVLLDEFRTDVGGLTPQEAQALLAWRGGTMADDLGLGASFGSALTKLVATVPTPALAEADALSAVVVVDRRRWFAAAEAVAVLPTLRDAAVRRRRVRMRYRSAGSDDAGVRTVDPMGLVEQAGRWYLLARHRGRTRSYRVSRVESAEVLDEVARLPDDLDLEAEWQRTRRRFEAGLATGVTVVIEVRAGAERELRSVLASRATAPVEAIGPAQVLTDGTRLRATLSAARPAVAMLLGFGGDVVLVEPDSLRAELVTRARASLDLHT